MPAWMSGGPGGRPNGDTNGGGPPPPRDRDHRPPRGVTVEAEVLLIETIITAVVLHLIAEEETTTTVVDHVPNAAIVPTHTIATPSSSTRTRKNENGSTIVVGHVWPELPNGISLRLRNKL